MSRRRGFVLPTTLLVMTLLTVMLTAAFTMVSAEYRTTDNSFARSRAHALAQAGLQTYYSLNRSLTAVSYDSVRIALTGGYVDVIGRRLRASTGGDDAQWLVRATAYASDALQSGQIAATRSVLQLGTLQTGFPARAALYAANGVHFLATGTGVTVDGDENPACAVMADIPGLVYPSGRLTWGAGSGASFSTSQVLPNGAAVIAATEIDWVALTGGTVSPDFTVPGSTPTWNTNSIILINGNYTLTNAVASAANPGQGILIVTGNLILASDPVWEGTILVGGRLITSTTSRYEIYGVVMTGLNIALGQAVTPDTLVRGNTQRELQWDSCRYLPAVASMNALAPISNAWINTWPSY